MVRIPFIGNFAVPVIFKSQFGRYDVNTAEPIAWLSPDSARAGEDTIDFSHGTTLWVGSGGRAEAAPDTAEWDEYPQRDRLQIRAGPDLPCIDTGRPPGIWPSFCLRGPARFWRSWLNGPVRWCALALETSCSSTRRCIYRTTVWDNAPIAVSATIAP